LKKTAPIDVGLGYGKDLMHSYDQLISISPIFVIKQKPKNHRIQPLVAVIFCEMKKI